jgi:hypothetical protein
MIDDLLLVVDDGYDIASLKISLENMGLSVSFLRSLVSLTRI